MDRTISQTFARGLAVLANLNAFNGASAAEIARRTGLNRVVVTRLLNTLTQEGYIRREGRPVRHYLCAPVQSLADGFVAEAWVNDVARPIVMEAGRRTVWPLSLAVNAGADMRVCVVTDPESPLTRRKIPVGLRLPLLQSAAGLVFLAFAEARVRQTLIDLAMRDSKTSGAALMGRLADVRAKGYAVSHSAEKVTQIAVPVLVRRQPVAALAVRYYSAAMTLPRAAATFLGDLRACAETIAADVR